MGWQFAWRATGILRFMRQCIAAGGKWTVVKFFFMSVGSTFADQRSMLTMLAVKSVCASAMRSPDMQLSRLLHSTL
jgi:hypothetical protein